MPVLLQALHERVGDHGGGGGENGKITKEFHGGVSRIA